jgi:hypothetical protein
MSEQGNSERFTFAIAEGSLAIITKAVEIGSPAVLKPIVIAFEYTNGTIGAVASTIGDPSAEDISRQN